MSNASETTLISSRMSIVFAVLLSGVLVSACSSRDDAEAGPRTGRTAAALSTCEHAACATGGPLLDTCDACTAALCPVDSYCCTVAWDATCVSEVPALCGQSCNAPPPPPPGTCEHPVCAAGGPLVSGCTTCSAQVCAQDPYCCTTAWDGTCVNEVASICGTACN